jgi:hypothetical protein
MAFLTKREAIKSSGLTADQFERCIQRGYLRKHVLIQKRVMFDDEDVNALRFVGKISDKAVWRRHRWEDNVMSVDRVAGGSHPVGEVRRTGRAHLPELRMAMPPRMQGRVDRVEKFGSLRAAIDLKCWDCTCGQVAEIRSCPLVACSLHSVRPFRPATPVTV